MLPNLVIYLLAGYVLDIIVGDPRWLPHPVRLIGCLITVAEKILRKIFNRSEVGLRLAGVIMTVSVVGLTFFSVVLILKLAQYLHPWLYHIVNVLLIYTILATRSLDRETRRVYQELVNGDLPAARKALANVVGRDTESLDEEQAARAAVETIAENTVDGVVTPLFYLALGGPALGMAYKAVSTLDSMVGYKNEKYLYLGWASARLDDLANWIPARLGGWLLIPLAALLSGRDFLLSLKTVARDRYKHESPNSAYSEAAMAGALRISLGGSCYYRGRLVEHPVIGEDLNPLLSGHIMKTIQLMYLTSGLMLGLAILIAIVRGG